MKHWVQIQDDLFCFLYSFAPSLPPPLIAYFFKIRAMGLFQNPIHEKECSYYVRSQKIKYYVMFPIFSTYVNYDVTILFSRSMWGEIMLRMFHVSHKKNLYTKHFACLLWWRNELQASIITYYVHISNDVCMYRWSIHTFIAQNMINILQITKMKDNKMITT